MVTGADNKYYRLEKSYESRILNGEPITEDEITKPFAFVFNNIATRIHDAKTASNVLYFISTLKRDEDVFNCISHIYNSNTRLLMLHTDSLPEWEACALRCWDFMDWRKVNMRAKTCRL